MARIELTGVAHRYGTAADAPYALHPVDFAWEDGGAYALLGPSGCGKTTMLNIISGLVRPSEGRIGFDGRDVTGLDTRARNIAQVFQFPVVYDTMTVRENLAFPLRNRRLAEGAVRARVEEVGAMLDLGPIMDRRAAGLDADTKQKISLGRGLVRSDTAAILFDEPLTVIDPAMKWRLRRKLKEVHQQVRRTLVYVTHDQNEALTFADRVVVMLNGRILQEGSPQALFERPEHRFVGFFIGSPGMNFLPGRTAEGGVVVDGTDIALPVAVDGIGGGQPVEVGIRPEFVEVADGPGPGVVDAEVRRVQDLGSHRLLEAAVGPHAMIAKLAEGTPVPDGRARLRFPPARALVYRDGVLVGAEQGT